MVLSNNTYYYYHDAFPQYFVPSFFVGLRLAQWQSEAEGSLDSCKVLMDKKERRDSLPKKEASAFHYREWSQASMAACKETKSQDERVIAAE